MMKTLIVDNIEIKVTKKKIKNINLSVHSPYGEVRISAPYTMKDETIRVFALSKVEWIKKQQEKMKNRKVLAPLEFVTGESHYFLGNKYKLNIIWIDKNPARVELGESGYINVYIKQSATTLQKEKLLKEWYRAQLKLLIPPLIKKWEDIMGVQVEEFGVKQMKTRWGTCNTSAKRIWINLGLGKKPPHCLEYIVVHEMVHLLERNHNKRFTAYMDQFLPNWPSIKKELNDG